MIVWILIFDFEKSWNRPKLAHTQAHVETKRHSGADGRSSIGDHFIPHAVSSINRLLSSVDGLVTVATTYLLGGTFLLSVAGDDFSCRF
jgi:hypothetical protein